MKLPKVPMQVLCFDDGVLEFHVEKYTLRLKRDENEDYNFAELETWAGTIVEKEYKANQDRIDLRRKLSGKD